MLGAPALPGSEVAEPEPLKPEPEPLQPREPREPPKPGEPQPWPNWEEDWEEDCEEDCEAQARPSMCRHVPSACCRGM